MVLFLAAPTLMEWIEKENIVVSISDFDDESKQFDEDSIDFKIDKTIPNTVDLFIGYTTTFHTLIGNKNTFNTLHFISVFSPPPDKHLCYFNAFLG